MIRKSVVVASCFPLLLALVASAEAQVRLERKLVGGMSKQSTEVNVDQTLVIAGMEQVTSNQTTAVVNLKSVKRDDGGVEIKETVESMQVSVSVQGMDYNFDSSNPDNKGSSQLEILRDFHKLAARSVSTTILDKEGKVVSVKSTIQDEINSLPEALQNLIKGEVSPERAKEQVEMRMAKLPDGLVEKGDSWDRTETAHFGQGQNMTFETRYTYEGTVEKNGKTLDKISLKAKSVEFSIADDSPLPLKVKNSDLKIAESSGHIHFDRQLGRTVEELNKVRIKGEMAFVVNGMELPATIDLKMEAKITAK